MIVIVIIIVLDMVIVSEIVLAQISFMSVDLCRHDNCWKNHSVMKNFPWPGYNELPLIYTHLKDYHLHQKICQFSPSLFNGTNLNDEN
jgi:hypothetical protein